MNTEEIVRTALFEWANKYQKRIQLDVIGSGDQISIRVIEVTSSIVRCARCGKRIFLEHEPKPKNYYCEKCFVAINGDKPTTRRELMESQGGKCIVKGCPYDCRWLGNMDVHRVVPGRNGGKYEPSNCVLVCRYHHPTIEGMTFPEIHKTSCSKKHYRRILESINLALSEGSFTQNQLMAMWGDG